MEKYKKKNKITMLKDKNKIIRGCSKWKKQLMGLKETGLGRGPKGFDLGCLIKINSLGLIMDQGTRGPWSGSYAQEVRVHA